jgi:CRISPR/Cas system-associated exonuclease Cas4 (RecB family)
LKIKHISISRSGVWEECQVKYRYKYHLEVLPTKPEPPYFAYGKLVHKAAEIYVKEKGTLPIRKIASDLLTGLHTEEFKNLKLSKEYKDKLPIHLDNIEKITTNIGYEGLLEYEIKLDMLPPNEKYLLGYVDRIIFKEDKTMILDYKTTKAGFYQKNNTTIKEDLQLRTYAYYICKKFNLKPESVFCCLYYLENKKLVCTNYTEKQMESAIEFLRENYNIIESTDESQARPNIGNHCRRCDFQNICPYGRNA